MQQRDDRGDAFLDTRGKEDEARDQPEPDGDQRDYARCIGAEAREQAVGGGRRHGEAPGESRNVGLRGCRGTGSDGRAKVPRGDRAVGELAACGEWCLMWVCRIGETPSRRIRQDFRHALWSSRPFGLDAPAFLPGTRGPMQSGRHPAGCRRPCPSLGDPMLPISSPRTVRRGPAWCG